MYDGVMPTPKSIPDVGDNSTVRLNLLVRGKTKRALALYAESQGISMSAAVAQLVNNNITSTGKPKG